MKFSINNILYFGLLASLLINPTIAKAASSTKNYHFLSGSVYYKYIYDDNHNIIGVEACSKNSDTKYDSGYGGSVVIPSEATDGNGNTYPVIGIESRFCAENKDITSVTIPSTVTYIGASAFDESGLTTITIPNNSSLKSIGSSAFSESKLSKITLPPSLRTLGDRAFMKTLITSITIPEGVTIIPEKLCWGCQKLLTVTLPNSTIRIDNGAFSPGLIVHNPDKDNEYNENLSPTITTLTLPSGINFTNCTYPSQVGFCVAPTAKIYCTSNNPLPQTSKLFPDNVYTSASLYVCSQATSKFSNTPYWNQFSNSPYSYSFSNKDIIQCNDINVKPDASTVLTISTSITESYKGFQFDLILPDNMTFSSAKLNDQLFANGWGTVKTYKYTDKIIRIQALPADNTQLASTLKDNIIELTLLSDENAEENSEINVSNFTFINSSNSVIYTYNKISKVTIVDIPIFSVNWTEDFGEPILREGETLALSAQYLPAATEKATYSWTSSAQEVATVSSTGVVTAKQAGVTKITVTAKNSLNEKSNSIYITVTEPIWGDANDNGLVNVADVITIGNTIAGRKVDKFFKITADINKDNSIDVSDLNATVNIILGKNTAALRAPKLGKQSVGDFLYTDNPVSTIDGEATVTVKIDNSYPYTALQADVIIPDGMTVKNVSLADGIPNHNLIYNVVDGNILKIVIYSLTNVPFSDFDKKLINIELATNGKVGNMYIENIIASDNNCNNYTLSFNGDCNLGTTSVTGLEYSDPQTYGTCNGIEISNANNCTIAIYDLSGRLICSFTANSNAERFDISAGLYIVKIGNQAFKVNVK